MHVRKRFRSWHNTAAALAGHAAGSYVRSRLESKGSSEPHPVSLYHEDEVLYKKRRPSVRRLRRRRRLVSLSRKIESLNNATNNMVRSFNFRGSWSPTGISNGQYVPLSIMLKGATSLGTSGVTAAVGDLHAILTDAYNITTYGTSVSIRSCQLDVFLRNTGSTLIYVDVYHVRARRDNAVTEDPATTWYNEQAIAPTPNTGTTVTNNQNQGLTPFQNPAFCRMWVITKKRRFLMSPDTSCSFQIRDHRSYRYQKELTTPENLLAIAGVTHGVMFVVYAAGLKASQTYLDGGSIEIVANKTYTYVAESVASAADCISRE